jgi:hypothetical protein
MDSVAFIAATGLFMAFACTVLRTELLNPRLGWAPSAPWPERLAHDALGVCAGLRGWLIFTGVIDPTGSEAALAVALALVTGIGLGKVVFYAVGDRVVAWIWRAWI